MTDFPASFPRAHRDGFPFRDAKPCACDQCGASFPSKSARRRHTANGCSGSGELTGSVPDEHTDDALQYGRMHGVITPEVKARADAEWAAMDDRGRLPDGWTYNA